MIVRCRAGEDSMKSANTLTLMRMEVLLTVYTSQSSFGPADSIRCNDATENLDNSEAGQTSQRHEKTPSYG